MMLKNCQQKEMELHTRRRKKKGKSSLPVRLPISFKNFLWKHGGEQKKSVQATWATPHSLALLSSEQHS